MKLVKELNYILDKKQKSHLAILAILILIGGILEAVGVGDPAGGGGDHPAQ